MDWIAAAVCALSVLLIGQKIIWGWPIGVLSCLLWMYVGHRKKVGGLIAINVVLLALQVRGWWLWSR